MSNTMNIKLYDVNITEAEATLKKSCEFLLLSDVTVQGQSHLNVVQCCPNLTSETMS